MMYQLWQTIVCKMLDRNEAGTVHQNYQNIHFVLKCQLLQLLVFFFLWVLFFSSLVCTTSAVIIKGKVSKRFAYFTNVLARISTLLSADLIVSIWILNRFQRKKNSTVNTKKQLFKQCVPKHVIILGNTDVWCLTLLSCVFKAYAVA